MPFICTLPPISSIYVADVGVVVVAVVDVGEQAVSPAIQMITIAAKSRSNFIPVPR
jgi:hypothetical protein